MSLRRINFLYSIICIFGYLVFHTVYKLKIEGRENLPQEGPAVILPKHQFWTDIPIVGLALGKPASYIAKQELFAYPIIRHLITFLGGVPIDRLKPVRSLESFRYVEHLLQKGDFIVLFPEGTYYPHAMGRGKHRFIQRLLNIQEKMGWKSEKPIPFIPIGIEYEKGKIRGKVTVKFAPPLFAREEAEAVPFTAAILDEIAKLSGLQPRREKLE
ncbi:MAG: phospholipid/glycerol acyltransferase, partial [Deltaproteobacteria bacterium]|nr:phospholipid/glycerol acyltransferase [Deltaproteobacteria bacterium]